MKKIETMLKHIKRQLDSQNSNWLSLKQAVDFTKDRAKRAVVSAATRNSRGRGTDRKTLQRGYVNPTIGADGSFY